MPVDVAVKKKYGDFELDVAFNSTGQRTGILGASGSGKSLTLKSIAGLIRPDEGHITVDDTVVFDSSRKIDVKAQKRNVGYLFQEYALFPNMTVEENIAAAIHARKKQRKDSNFAPDTADILERFRLSDVRTHHPDELSGGQKQRCALARMLACDPKLLLLDEPFSAVDTFLREGMRLELIRILDKYEKDVIIVSHDRDELFQMCDRLVLIERGKVIAEGDTEEVFASPGTPAAARLTGCKNISRIGKISDHRVIALDWNDIELVTACSITEETTHIGIRAHDIMAGEHGENVIPCARATVSKLPFEWYVTLECGLWWKLPKELGEEYSGSLIPGFVSILPEKIIPLSGQT